MFFQAVRDTEKCQECGVCLEIVACAGQDESCIGCGACVLACPHTAIDLIPVEKTDTVTISIDEKEFVVPEKIPIKTALSLAGYSVGVLPDDAEMFAPCGAGACFCCAVEIEGDMYPSCVTGAEMGMHIKTLPLSGYIPKRLVGGFSGHGVGGVGTPWDAKKEKGYVEVACFAGGCNLRCPQCQNWMINYGGKGLPLTPREAAQKITEARHAFGVDRMAISGGECTLNKPWLIRYVEELKKLNPDSQARFHVDTNGSLLTPESLDQLVQAGMTDIGIDLKGLTVQTYQRITGINDQALAQIYLDNAWTAVRYFKKQYHDQVFVGVGIPFNKELIAKAEIKKMGQKLARLDPHLQVCVLDYRPEFRSTIKRPGDEEMLAVRNLLQDTGLSVVLCQTTTGQIGP